MRHRLKIRRERSSQAANGDHHALWRDPAEIISLSLAPLDATLLRYRVEGKFWEILAKYGLTLLVTREYEHLVMAFHAAKAQVSATYLPLPHPSGLAVEQHTGRVYIASTRNPNQIFELCPVSHPSVSPGRHEPVLMPLRSHFYPGSLYLHDLAFIAGKLHGNAVGKNAIVRFESDGTYTPVWWPRCVESAGRSQLERNYVQLNSIAAGRSLADSYFSASTDVIATRRPGALNFRPEGVGVVFSGRTREPSMRGLTRPHSARFHRSALWVCNSGYGEVGLGVYRRFEARVRLPGWTRGLCFAGSVGFVGTSRVLPRFRHYAPGIDAGRSRCGVHAFDTASGEILGRLWFPKGDQIFAVDYVPQRIAAGLPFDVRRARRHEKALFHGYRDPSLREAQS